MAQFLSDPTSIIESSCTKLSLKAPEKVQEGVFQLSSFAAAEFLELIGIGAGFTSLDMQGFALAQINKKLDQIKEQINTVLGEPAITAFEFLQRGVQSLQAENNAQAYREFEKVVDNSIKGRIFQKENLQTVANLSGYVIFADLMINTYVRSSEVFMPYELLEPKKKLAIKNKVMQHLEKLLETQKNQKSSFFFKKQKNERNQNIVDDVLKSGLQFICPPGEPIPVRFIPEGEEDAVWLNLNGKPGVLDANSVYIFKNGSNVVIRHYSINEKHEANINCEHRVELMIKANHSGITLDDSSEEVNSSSLNSDDLEYLISEGYFTKSFQAIGVDIKKFSRGDTALMWASREGYLEVVSELLQHPGIKINHVFEGKDTALISAIKAGHLEVVSALLQHPGIDVNKQNKGDDTALISASKAGHLEVVSALLQHPGIAVNKQNKGGDTALTSAILKGHLEVVSALLQHPGIDVNKHNNSGDTALMLSILKGYLEVVSALLQHPGIEVNKQDKDGDTALTSAILKGHLEVVSALLQHPGIEVNKQNKSGDTALTSAILKGHLEVVSALLQHPGIAVNKPGYLGATPLHMSAWIGHLELTRLLLNADADLEAKDESVSTPLHIAANEGRLEVTRFLLNAGAHVEAEKKDLQTPLHRAAWKGHLEVTRLLLNAGADLNAKTKGLNTPLHFAAQEGHLEVTKLLVQKGGKVDAKNSSGETPADVAKRNNKKEVELFLNSK